MAKHPVSTTCSSGLLAERPLDNRSHGMRRVDPLTGDARHELIGVERPTAR